MKKFTPGEIQNIFVNEDKDTITKKKNIKDFTKTNNIKHIKSQGCWLIDLDDLLEKVNPSKTKSKETLPRLRTKISAQKEWNSTHRRKIKHYIIDICCESENVFVYKHGRRNIINYDELEIEIIKKLKEQGKF